MKTGPLRIRINTLRGNEAARPALGLRGLTAILENKQLTVHQPARLRG